MKARREALALPVALFAALCGLAPLVAMAVVSVARIEGYTLALALDLRAWREVAASPVMRGLIGQAVFYGAILACLTPLAAYPIALALARTPMAWKWLGAVVLLTPLYTGEIVRIYAWRLMLGAQGLINAALGWAGLIEAPVQALLYTRLSALIVMFYNTLPFMVLAIWAAVEAFDRRLAEAARDLGASPWVVFRRVTLPLTRVGLFAGMGVVFALGAGDALTPALMGGANGATAMSMIESLFGAAFDWPLASALGLALMLTLAGCVAALTLLAGRARRSARRSARRRGKI